MSVPSVTKLIELLDSLKGGPLNQADLTNARTGHIAYMRLHRFITVTKDPTPRPGRPRNIVTITEKGRAFLGLFRRELGHG